MKVIEDATEALGTKYTEGRYKGKYAGTIGHFGAFSFNGNKIITTGGGGAVTANDSKTVDHMRFLSTQAKTDPHYYIHNEVGYNYRMTNLQAALGVAQMEELPEFIQRKQKNYDLYKKAFDGYEYGTLMPFRKGTDSNKWFYSICIDRDHIKASMRDIITILHEKGIETRAIWGLINEQIPYEGETTYKLEKAPFAGHGLAKVRVLDNLAKLLAGVMAALITVNQSFVIKSCSVALNQDVDGLKDEINLQRFTQYIGQDLERIGIFDDRQIKECSAAWNIRYISQKDLPWTVLTKLAVKKVVSYSIGL